MSDNNPQNKPSHRPKVVEDDEKRHPSRDHEGYTGQINQKKSPSSQTTEPRYVPIKSEIPEGIRFDQSFKRTNNPLHRRDLDDIERSHRREEGYLNYYLRKAKETLFGNNLVNNDAPSWFQHKKPVEHSDRLPVTKAPARRPSFGPTSSTSSPPPPPAALSSTSSTPALSASGSETRRGSSASIGSSSSSDSINSGGNSGNTSAAPIVVQKPTPGDNAIPGVSGHNAGGTASSSSSHKSLTGRASSLPENVYIPLPSGNGAHIRIKRNSVDQGRPPSSSSPPPSQP